MLLESRELGDLTPEADRPDALLLNPTMGTSAPTLTGWNFSVAPDQSSFAFHYAIRSNDGEGQVAVDEVFIADARGHQRMPTLMPCGTFHNGKSSRHLKMFSRLRPNTLTYSVSPSGHQTDRTLSCRALCLALTPSRLSYSQSAAMDRWRS